MRRTTTEFRTEFTVDGSGDVIRDALANAYQMGEAKDRRFHHGSEATCLIKALDKAGFEVVRKPKPGSNAVERVEFARRTGCWDGVSDRDYREWVQSLSFGIPTGRVFKVVYAKEDGSTETVEHAEYVKPIGVSFDPPPTVGGKVAGATVLRATETVRLEPGQAEPTETERAARWASVLIAQILEDGSARQAEAGVEAAGRDALARLKRDRGRVAFEDIDQPPPMAASLASEAVATWVRSLGDAVVWCQERLMLRRIQVAACLQRWPDRDQSVDINRRVEMIRSMRGVVGVDFHANATGEDAEGVRIKCEIRFDYYITTVGATFSPLDLPARPREAA